MISPRSHRQRLSGNDHKKSRDPNEIEGHGICFFVTISNPYLPMKDQFCGVEALIGKTIDKSGGL